MKFSSPSRIQFRYFYDVNTSSKTNHSTPKTGPFFTTIFCKISQNDGVRVGTLISDTPFKNEPEFISFWPGICTWYPYRAPIKPPHRSSTNGGGTEPVRTMTHCHGTTNQIKSHAMVWHKSISKFMPTGDGQQHKWFKHKNVQCKKRSILIRHRYFEFLKSRHLHRKSAFLL